MADYITAKKVCLNCSGTGKVGWFKSSCDACNGWGSMMTCYRPDMPEGVVRAVQQEWPQRVARASIFGFLPFG